MSYDFKRFGIPEKPRKRKRQKLNVFDLVSIAILGSLIAWALYYLWYPMQVGILTVAVGAFAALPSAVYKRWAIRAIGLILSILLIIAGFILIPAAYATAWLEAEANGDSGLFGFAVALILFLFCSAGIMLIKRGRGIALSFVDGNFSTTLPPTPSVVSPTTAELNKVMRFEATAPRATKAGLLIWKPGVQPDGQWTTTQPMHGASGTDLRYTDFTLTEAGTWHMQVIAWYPRGLSARGPVIAVTTARIPPPPPQQQ